MLEATEVMELKNCSYDQVHHSVHFSKPIAEQQDQFEGIHHFLSESVRNAGQCTTTTALHCSISLFPSPLSLFLSPIRGYLACPTAVLSWRLLCTVCIALVTIMSGMVRSSPLAVQPRQHLFSTTPGKFCVCVCVHTCSRMFVLAKTCGGRIMWDFLCRTYRSVGDETFMKAFETATLAYEDWTHEVV